MGQNVLLIDDEEVFATLAAEQLTRRGFNVVVAASGVEALEKIKTQRPDVILLDFLLPGINGSEVLKRLKADPRTHSIPVVICSITLHERSAISAFMSQGARDFVPKPCQPDALAAKLREIIGPKI